MTVKLRWFKPRAQGKLHASALQNFTRASLYFTVNKIIKAIEVERYGG